MKKIFLTVLVLFSISFLPKELFAQSGAENKLNSLIGALEETKFLKDYKTFKEDMEGLVAEIKMSEATPTEVAKTKLAYKQSKTRFDALLDQLKRDLSNSAIRKLMAKSPDDFSKKYQKQLDEAKLYCNDNFTRKASALLEEYALDVEDMELLVGSFFTIFKSFSEKKEATNEFSATYLELNLIEPLRFKAWDAVEE